MKYSIERINTMQPDFLSKAKKGGYICPECGNGSGADGTGITKKGSSTHYKCFKCGLYEDTFNLYCRYAGITDIAAAADFSSAYTNKNPPYCRRRKLFHQSHTHSCFAFAPVKTHTE